MWVKLPQSTWQNEHALESADSSLRLSPLIDIAVQSCSVVNTCVQSLIPLLSLELFKDANCEFYVFMSLLEHKPDT